MFAELVVFVDHKVCLKLLHPNKITSAQIFEKCSSRWLTGHADVYNQSLDISQYKYNGHKI